ncbi:MAG: winged helix-turn-helix transcriptional regulator, partial [Candidatus Thermoplasmatota archaeon]|nr:winged helix-turn-helix transcriptional regulator [Candidatus Thermoplasmatota archaeon]
DAQRFEDDPFEPDARTPPPRAPTIASALGVWASETPEGANATAPNAFVWTLQRDGPHLSAGWEGEEPDDFSGFGGFWGPDASKVELGVTDGALRSVERSRTQGTSWAFTGGSPDGDVGWTATTFQGMDTRPLALDAPAVVGVAGVSLLVLIGLILVKAGVGVPLYSRLTREEILDNPLRRRIYEVVGEEPGLSMAAIARRADCSASTARYHLDRLSREEMVVRAGHEGLERWFVKGKQPRQAAELEAVLAVGNSREVFEAIQAHPGSSLGEVAEHVGTSPPAAHKVVNRLVEAGVVTKRREGRRVALFVAESLDA